LVRVRWSSPPDPLFLDLAANRLARDRAVHEFGILDDERAADEDVRNAGDAKAASVEVVSLMVLLPLIDFAFEKKVKPTDRRTSAP
jgi:hypothetical protein